MAKIPPSITAGGDRSDVLPSFQAFDHNYPKKSLDYLHNSERQAFAIPPFESSLRGFVSKYSSTERYANMKKFCCLSKMKRFWQTFSKPLTVLPLVASLDTDCIEEGFVEWVERYRMTRCATNGKQRPLKMLRH